MNDYEQTLDERLRHILTALKMGALSVEDARMILRVEVLASFWRGRQCAKKRPMKDAN